MREYCRHDDVTLPEIQVMYDVEILLFLECSQAHRRYDTGAALDNEPLAKHWNPATSHVNVTLARPKEPIQWEEMHWER